MLERYPVTAEEVVGLPPGVRLARHVPGWECEKCVLATMDHTSAWQYPTTVCLKDLAGAQTEKLETI